MIKKKEMKVFVKEFFKMLLAITFALICFVVAIGSVAGIVWYIIQTFGIGVGIISTFVIFILFVCIFHAFMETKRKSKHDGTQ